MTLSTPWSAFSTFRYSDRVVLLYAQPSTTYQIFPRLLFANDNDWQAFLEFVQARFPET